MTAPAVDRRDQEPRALDRGERRRPGRPASRRPSRRTRSRPARRRGRRRRRRAAARPARRASPAPPRRRATSSGATAGPTTTCQPPSAERTQVADRRSGAYVERRRPRPPAAGPPRRRARRTPARRVGVGPRRAAAAAAHQRPVARRAAPRPAARPRGRRSRGRGRRRPRRAAARPAGPRTSPAEPLLDQPADADVLVADLGRRERHASRSARATPSSDSSPASEPAGRRGPPSPSAASGAARRGDQIRAAVVAGWTTRSARPGRRGQRDPLGAAVEDRLGPHVDRRRRRPRRAGACRRPGRVDSSTSDLDVRVAPAVRRAAASPAMPAPTTTTRIGRFDGGRSPHHCRKHPGTARRRLRHTAVRQPEREAGGGRARTCHGKGWASPARLAALLVGCSGGGRVPGATRRRCDRPPVATGRRGGLGASGRRRTAAARDAAPRTAGRTAVQTRPVISTGRVELVADDLETVRDELDRLLGRYGGHVAKEQTSKDDDGAADRSELELRVPSRHFGQLMSRPRGARDTSPTRPQGRSTSPPRSSTWTPGSAPRRSASTGCAGSSARPRDVDAMIRLESEIARREADLASLRAQQDYLDDQTSLSTTISLTMTRDHGRSRRRRRTTRSRTPASSPGCAAAGTRCSTSCVVAATVVGALLPVRGRARPGRAPAVRCGCGRPRRQRRTTGASQPRRLSA